MPATQYKNVFWYSGKIRFIEPQGINGHRRPVPGAPSRDMCRDPHQKQYISPRLPRSQYSGTGPSASCGYCCPLCPAGVQYSGKIRFIEPQGIDGHRRPVPGAPSRDLCRDPHQKQYISPRLHFHDVSSYYVS